MTALVELRAPATEAGLRDHCRAALASYKIPRAVLFTDTLPRDPNGTVRKREIRNRFWAGRGRAIEEAM